MLQAATDPEQGSARPPPDHLMLVGACGAGRTTVEALRPTDGLALWCYERQQLLHDLVCHDGTVFVATSSPSRTHPDDPAHIVALRAGDGAQLWQTGPTRIHRQMVKTRLLCGLRVALETVSLVSAWWAARSLRLAGYTYLKVDGDILLACTGPVIFAFSAHSGALRWIYPTPLGPERQLLAAHGGRVYASGGQRPFLALDALTGHVLWRYDRGFAPLALVADDQHVYTYTGTRAGWAITTVRASDGALVQTLPLQRGRETLAALTPGGAEGSIAYLMRDSRLCAVRLHDGEELWRADPLLGVPEEGIGSPFSTVQLAVTQQSLFYAYVRYLPETRSMQVGALDARSGAALWRWHGPERPLPQHHGLYLTAALGNLYLSTGDGVFAFGGADGRLLWHVPSGFDPAPIAPALAQIHG